MVEKNLIINNRELNYKGIFRFDELVSKINQVISERGYPKNEKRSEELVTEAGRKIFIELRPRKWKTAYASMMIKMRITVDNLSDLIQEKDDLKKKFQQGEINIGFDSWVITDYQGRWGMKPWAFFVKGFINKYFYKWPLENSFTDEVSADTAYVYAEIKKLLTSYSSSETKHTSEQEVMKHVEDDIVKVERQDFGSELNLQK